MTEGATLEGRRSTIGKTEMTYLQGLVKFERALSWP